MATNCMLVCSGAYGLISLKMKHSQGQQTEIAACREIVASKCIQETQIMRATKGIVYVVRVHHQLRQELRRHLLQCCIEAEFIAIHS